MSEHIFFQGSQNFFNLIMVKRRYITNLPKTTQQLVLEFYVRFSKTKRGVSNLRVVFPHQFVFHIQHAILSEHEC